MAARTTIWSRVSPPRERAFAVDAAAVGVAGLALATGATWLGRELAIDATFLRTVGLLLLPWTACVAWVSQRPHTWSTRAVIAGNLLWVAGSIGALASRAIAPNGLGTTFVLIQALAVAVLAGWQVLESRSPASVRR